MLVHAPTDNVSSAFAEIAGWSEVSGAALDQGLRARVLEAARAILGQTDWRSATRLTCGATDVRERDAAARRDDGSLRVVLFGFGNYAKTTAIPNLPRGISLAAVHELDPTQLPVFGRLKAAVDSSPRFRPDERYDVALVAGFHHTHAPLAIEALDCGQWAIIEKPLVTDADQLAAILAAMDRHPGKLFVCFQRRYSALTELARQDLDLGDGEPVSYHCIVHEPLLPARHWYRWPNSKSRIVTNACHWIDHFLYLNGWAEAHRSSVQTASDSTIACFAELVNGACFTMSISYAGSERVGVQDYVELHAKGMTVRIVNQSHYSAESNDRVVRTARINKISTYRSMYRRIGEQILAGGPGDCRQSVVSSCGLMLQLDAELAEIMGPRDVLGTGRSSPRVGRLAGR